MNEKLPQGYTIDAINPPEGFILDGRQEVEPDDLSPPPVLDIEQEIKTHMDAAVRELSQPQELSIPESFIRSLGDIFTGEKRRTEQTDALPELGESGLLSGESIAKTAALSPVLLTTTNTDEIVDIVTSNFPNVGVTYNKDADGGVYPVLVNNKTGAATVINRPGFSANDALQLLGLAAAYTPAGKGIQATTIAAKSALTETAIQGAQEATGGDFGVGDVALAGFLGFASKAAEGILGAVGRYGKGSAKNKAVDAATDAGIPTFTSDVLPPETFSGKVAQQTAEKIPFFGTGTNRAAQQQFREEAVDEFVQRYADYSYEAIVQSMKTAKDTLKRAAGDVMEFTGKKLDNIGDIPHASTRRAATAVRSELSRPGIIKEGTALEKLDILMQALDDAPQTFTSLKENRTAFRTLVNEVDAVGRSQLGSKQKMLLQRVENGLTSDMKTFAKANLEPSEFAAWTKANKSYADEAIKFTKTRLKNVLDKGDMTPESVQNMLFSQKPSELKSLYTSLTPDGQVNARAAIISKVAGNLSRRSNGITPNSFASELKKFQPQINAFFKGDERKQLEGLSIALDATRRAQDAGVTTPTGQSLWGAFFGGGTVAKPELAIPAMVGAGGAGRLYESAPVRNALLKLASVPKGSTEFDKALTAVFESVTVAAQASKTQVLESQTQKE